jgi:hypothetical protein
MVQFYLYHSLKSRWKRVVYSYAPTTFSLCGLTKIPSGKLSATCQKEGAHRLGPRRYLILSSTRQLQSFDKVSTMIPLPSRTLRRRQRKKRRREL